MIQLENFDAHFVDFKDNEYECDDEKETDNDKESNTQKIKRKFKKFKKAVQELGNSERIDADNNSIKSDDDKRELLDTTDDDETKSSDMTGKEDMEFEIVTDPILKKQFWIGKDYANSFRRTLRTYTSMQKINSIELKCLVCRGETKVWWCLVKVQETWHVTLYNAGIKQKSYISTFIDP